MITVITFSFVIYFHTESINMIKSKMVSFPQTITFVSLKYTSLRYLAKQKENQMPLFLQRNNPF